MFEVSHPYTRHLSLIFFAGPQISYLIDNDGGLIAYREGKTYDYFDLASSKYWVLSSIYH